MELKQQMQQRDKTLMTLSAHSGLDSDESYEGVSESSFKDALVFDGSSQKNNGSVPQQNGIKKHRSGRIPPLFICVFVRLYSFTRHEVPASGRVRHFHCGIEHFFKTVLLIPPDNQCVGMM